MPFGLTLSLPFHRFRCNGRTLVRRLIVTVLLSVHPFAAVAAQADVPACRGTNILRELKVSDHGEYARLQAEGNKIPNARGTLWKIAKPGIKPSYLLGTFHVSDPRVLKTLAGSQKLQHRARVVVLESEEVLDVRKAFGLALTKPDLLMMPAGKRIEDFMTKQQAELVTSVLKERGLAFSALNYLRPWLVSGSLTFSGCEAARKRKGIAVLDQAIALDAVKHGIPVKGLETFEEQYSAMNSMPIETQVRSLVEAMAFRDQLENITETMIDLYVGGDLRLLRPLLTRYSLRDDATVGDIYPEFEAAMLTRRNHVMAERAVSFLDAGNAFIAVGAMHLQGAEGLVELLRQKGYKVVPVR